MFEDAPTDEKKPSAKPPNPIDVLLPILRGCKRRPSMFPQDPTTAAKFWIAKQEPPNEFTEAIRQESRKDGSKYFITPYHDRLAANLKTFVQLQHIHQVFVIDAIDRGIPWRGDDIHKFTKTVEQHNEMLKDPEAYIGNASKLLREMRRGAA